MNQIRSFEELRNAGLRDTTDLTDAEIKTIAAFVMTNEQRKPNARYMEIGVLAGTTIRFCKHHTKTTHFTGIDLFEDFFPDPLNSHISGTFKKEDVERICGDRVNLIKGDSHNILPTLKDKGEEFDFIFIDGDHSFRSTLKDFMDAKELLAIGGQIAFHNASAHLEPDFSQYVMKDGGPWLVTEQLMMGKLTEKWDQWKMVADVDRLRVFVRC